jgi:hypothetical protein
MTDFVNQNGDLVFSFLVDVDGLSSLGAKPIASHLPVSTALPESHPIPAREVSIPNRFECGNEKVALGAFAQFKRRRHSVSGVWLKKEQKLFLGSKRFLYYAQICLPYVRAGPRDTANNNRFLVLGEQRLGAVTLRRGARPYPLINNGIACILLKGAFGA